MGFLIPLAAPLLASAGGMFATAGAAATTASVASTVLGATGSMLGGVATATAAGYRAKVAKMNAGIAENNAEQAVTEGAFSESQQRLKTTELIGEQKASQAGNGVDVNFGSALDVRQSTAMMGNLDALTIRYNAAKEAHAQRVAAAGYRAEAAQAKSAGRFGLLKGFIGAASSIAGGVSDYALTKSKFAQVGVK